VTDPQPAPSTPGERTFRPGGRQTIPRPPVWEAVDAPLDVGAPLHVTTDSVVHAVRGGDVARMDVDFSGVRPSAVLVVLADDQRGDAGVLLTRRSTALRNHSGEMSFPGGRIDGDETAVEAAVREAHEEVGLDPASVEIVGELNHLATVVSRSHIVPIVGRIPHQIELSPASAEVERVMWVPLTEFVRTDTYRAERWTVPWGERVLYFFELDDETVWGATAVILRDLFSRLGAARDRS
jgi:8-oxo-dGTP pyrophosphatase MutT (NUDIX family)